MSASFFPPFGSAAVNILETSTLMISSSTDGVPGAILPLVGAVFTGVFETVSALPLPTSVTLPEGVNGQIRWAKVVRVGVCVGVAEVTKSGFLSKNLSRITSASVIIRALSSGYFVK